MRFLVRKLDDVIRWCTGVFEFTQDANCILRVQVTRAKHPAHLPDVDLKPGDSVLLIHLWNERLPQFPLSGADLAWAKRTLHLFRCSLNLVAEYLHNEPRLSDVCAVGGETILLHSGLHTAGKRFVQDLGFMVVPYHHRLGCFGEFLENFYSLLIIWSFNPGGLPKRSLFHLQRSAMWMSRKAFLQRFSKGQGSA